MTHKEVLKRNKRLTTAGKCCGFPVVAVFRPLPRHRSGKTACATLVTCLRGGKQSTELRYYLSSLEMGVKNFARAVRGHWGIENSCHWPLDFTYREDEFCIRGNQVRENVASLNRFTLSFLMQHPDKASLVMKRRSCNWSDKFLTQVVTGATL
ncbi:MAG: ISAs1 family transposase [Planctomycetia bacterium]|nr:ISAs1 family transposase [Planctomycetia bacterium]